MVNLAGSKFLILGLLFRIFHIWTIAFYRISYYYLHSWTIQGSAKVLDLVPIKILGILPLQYPSLGYPHTLTFQTLLKFSTLFSDSLGRLRLSLWVSGIPYQRKIFFILHWLQIVDFLFLVFVLCIFCIVLQFICEES